MGKFSSNLILWYKDNKRALPWRDSKETYEVWVSEIILQQTRVDQGLSYYYKFLENFPTVHHLAKASEDEVLKCWQGLGYYSRARNMHFAAKFVSEQLNGIFPDSYDGLLQLKGIGTYTAAAISSICYNEHRTVVDGNVFRVLTRIYGIKTAINTSQGKKEVEELAHSLNDVKEHGEFNQSLMEFGALHCTPKKPLCTSCIFNDICWALQNKQVDSLPLKEKKVKVKKRYLYYILLKDGNEQTLIQRRNEDDIWKGLYQFPLIETPKEVSLAEIFHSEDFKILIDNQDIKMESEKKIKHQLTHRQLFITIINIQIESLKHLQNSSYQLIKLNQLHDFAFPKPLNNII